MRKFLKAQAASLIATTIDFRVTLLLVSGMQVYYLAGSALGTIIGGLSYFLLGRRWVFEATKGRIHFQLIKYFLVWIVYLLISTGAVFVLTHYAGLVYIYSKVLVAVTMSMTYNYLLHRRFVFRQ